MKMKNDTLVIPFEDSALEYKETITRDDLPRQIVALANANGGKVKIGITDNRTIVGVQGISSEDITNAARDGCIPPIIPEITIEDYEDKQVISVKVPKGIHPPYRTVDGKYKIRVGPTVRDTSVDELIDLIVRGPHKGTILLRAKLDDLKNSISAALSSHTETGTQHAIEGINQIIELVRQSPSESANLNAIRVIGEISKRATGFNDKVTSEIVSYLSILFSVYLVPNYREYIPSEQLFVGIIDIVENIFRTITIVPKKTDLTINVLTAFYRISLGCIWAGYESQTKRIYNIINEQNGRDRKLSKCCNSALSMIKKMEQETDIYEPRRAGALTERVTD